jgi:hypothetical protein
MEFAKKFNFGRSSAIGSFLEPAKTSANLIAQTILGAPFSWRWNRQVIGFVTVAGQQDYYIFNWTASTPVQKTWMTIDSNGNSQTVTVAGTVGTVPPTWNTATQGTTTDGSVTWTNLGPINTTVSQTYSFSWLETQSIQIINPNTNQPTWKEIESKICLGLDSGQARPGFVSAQTDDGSGNISFRMMPCPDQAYPVALTMQSKPPVFSKISQTWAPIPDEYSHIYNWGFLSLMLLFADDVRSTFATQKFIGSLLATNHGLTETEINVFLNNWQSTVGQMMMAPQKAQQAMQARGQS